MVWLLLEGSGIGKRIAGIKVEFLSENMHLFYSLTHGILRFVFIVVGLYVSLPYYNEKGYALWRVFQYKGSKNKRIMYLTQ